MVLLSVKWELKDCTVQEEVLRSMPLLCVANTQLTTGYWMMTLKLNTGRGSGTGTSREHTRGHATTFMEQGPRDLKHSNKGLLKNMQFQFNFLLIVCIYTYFLFTNEQAQKNLAEPSAIFPLPVCLTRVYHVTCIITTLFVKLTRQRSFTYTLILSVLDFYAHFYFLSYNP